jgi:hypothetical protein
VRKKIIGIFVFTPLIVTAILSSLATNENEPQGFTLDNVGV